MEKEISITVDSLGDTFISGFEKYTKHGLLFKLHMEQIIENYENCFGEKPTPEKLNAAFEFIKMFFAEISETHPTSQYNRHISSLSWMLGLDAVETIENICSL